MERSEDYTLSFEAVKTSFRQTKDGYHLTLVIHPSDVESLPDLISSWVGTRYQCCLVQLNDENEPVKTKDSEEGQSLIQQAGMLCRSSRFQGWIHSFMKCNPEERDVWGENEEEHTARLLRQACGISSRSELRDNLRARETFKSIYESYIDHIEERR
tara:strand:+ start:1843 stop:2313 length:471 start_codon:yes stop_codon:yes gene_type:complete